MEGPCGPEYGAADAEGADQALYAAIPPFMKARAGSARARELSPHPSFRVLRLVFIGSRKCGATVVCAA